MGHRKFLGAVNTAAIREKQGLHNDEPSNDDATHEAQSDVAETDDETSEEDKMFAGENIADFSSTK